jgi:hypothetical protein
MDERRSSHRPDSERRRSVRVGDAIPIRTFAGDYDVAITCGAQLSEHGLFVEYVLPYPEGTQLILECVLPGVGELKARAEVVSAQEWLPSDLSRKLGNGLRFVELDDAARGNVRDFLRRSLG